MIKSPLKIAQEILQLDSTEYYGDHRPVQIILSEAVVKLAEESDELKRIAHKVSQMHKRNDERSQALKEARDLLLMAPSQCPERSLGWARDCDKWLAKYGEKK